MPITLHRSSNSAFPRMNDSRNPRPGSQPNRRAIARAFVVASTMAGAVGAGIGGGYLLDQHFASKPVWTVSLSLLGLGLGLYQVIREIMR
jgi:F0F1-type ATP synthase assembly protein I